MAGLVLSESKAKGHCVCLSTAAQCRCALPSAEEYGFRL